MVSRERAPPSAAKDEVTTPAGCTVDGLLELEDGKVRATLDSGDNGHVGKSWEGSFRTNRRLSNLRGLALSCLTLFSEVFMSDNELLGGDFSLALDKVLQPRVFPPGC